MKSVLISIKPKWCELIASGTKTVEVRKTKPKLETPFKVYIYCTNNGGTLHLAYDGLHYHKSYVGKDDSSCINGKVIGEFVCRRIDFCGFIFTPDHPMWKTGYDKNSCLTTNELYEYAKGGTFYEWHVSDLVIYDEPRELSEFHKPCADIKNCLNRAFRESGRSLDKCFDCGCRITRPPQSWCYVEDTE